MYITIPEPVTLRNKVTGETLLGSDGEQEKPFTLYRFVVTFVTPDPRWGAGRSALRAMVKFEDTLEHAKPGDVVRIDTDWRDRAMKIIDATEGESPGAIMSQLLPLMDAIADATDEPPGGSDDG